MSSNPFVRDIPDYKRDLDIVGNAVQDSAHFLHIQTGKPLQVCLDFVTRVVSAGGKFELKPRDVKLTKRKPNGDRIKHMMTFDSLVGGVKKTDSIFSPNMVVYSNPEKNLSFLAAFIDDNMARRGVVKKKGQKAKMEKNMQLAAFCENQQTVIKTLNNSLSGAHASPHNPVYNKTAHSTLTSATRIATSYGNAATEKLLAGNRHYWNAQVTLNNVITITRHTDYNALQAVMLKYNLVAPTVSEVMELIDRCTNMYWVDPVKLETVYTTVSKLTDLQRAAFAYTGDLYHIAKHNGDFIRQIITELVTRPSFTVEDPDSHVANCNGDIVALCGILCSDLLAGMQVSKLKETNYNDYLIYASTVAHVNTVFDKYADFIKVFLATDNMPASIYHFPYSIRRVVVGSDTDSTMFTCQDWVEWYCKKLDMSIDGQRVSAAIMYFNTQVIAHSLAMISRQMGVVDKNMYRLQMKNEYSFLVYMVANRSKHYITMINAKEGNIYKVPELDTKGVALKNSKIPPKIMKTSDNLIKMITGDIMSGKNIDIYPLQQRIANIEHEIFASLQSGSFEYLSRAHIKVEGAYKKPAVSSYVHYHMWQAVFAEKYGQCSPPPYACVKVSNTLDTAKRFEDWIATMDPETGNRMTNWLKSVEKEKLTQFLLPMERMLNGVPKEFIAAMDQRRVVKELMESFYIILEMCGFYFKNKHTTRLLSDEIAYRPEFGSFIAEQ